MERTVVLPGPLDLRRTLRGTATWGFATWLTVGPDGGWYAARTDSGPGAVHLRQDGERVHATAHGPGGAELLDGVEDLLGLNDRPEALVPHHPVVAELVRRHPGLRIARTGRVYPTLVSVVLAQRVTGKESALALRRLVRAWGEPAPGNPELWLPPAPETLAQVPSAAFHPLGVERQRAERVIAVARRARRMEEAAAMPYDQGAARLGALPGIGPWTVGVVMGEALGDPDAVPVGDYHLPNTVAFVLAGEPRADDARMLELLEPYRGQRGRVVRLMKAAGLGAPRYGPRSEARDLRGH